MTKQITKQDSGVATFISETREVPRMFPTSDDYSFPLCRKQKHVTVVMHNGVTVLNFGPQYIVAANRDLTSRTTYDKMERWVKNAAFFAEGCLKLETERQDLVIEDIKEAKCDYAPARPWTPPEVLRHLDHPRGPMTPHVRRGYTRADGTPVAPAVINVSKDRRSVIKDAYGISENYTLGSAK